MVRNRLGIWRDQRKNGTLDGADAMPPIATVPVVGQRHDRHRVLDSRFWDLSTVAHMKMDALPRSDTHRALPSIVESHHHYRPRTKQLPNEVRFLDAWGQRIPTLSSDGKILS